MSSSVPFLRPALCAGLLLAAMCGVQAARAASAAAGAATPSVAPAMPATSVTPATASTAGRPSTAGREAAPVASAASATSDASPASGGVPSPRPVGASAAAPMPLELGIPDLRQRIAERLAATRAVRAAARRGAVAETAPIHAEPVAREPEGARQAALVPTRAGATPPRAVPATEASGEEARAAAASTAPASPARRAARRAPASAAPGEPGWSYEGATGPEAWATLDPAYARCGSGRRQSPIDIRDGISVDLQPLGFDYRPGAFSVLDDGHTVRVDVAAGSTLAVGGRRYMLRQFHFHRPSEERLDGRGYPMSAHLVHADAEGRLAVVAVLIDSGKAHPVVQQVWNDLPLERHAPQSGAGPLDPAALLPVDRRYATFMGSLTTPPCTEGVLWIVLRQPATVSPEQMSIFARLYPMNARPLQAASGRLIKQSN